MRNLLFIVAVIFVVGWLIGIVGFHVGGAIHLLLIVAIIAVLVSLVKGEKTL